MITTVSLAQPKQLCHVDEPADDRKSSNGAEIRALDPTPDPIYERQPGRCGKHE